MENEKRNRPSVDELVSITGLYAYINVERYRVYLARATANGRVPFTEADMPLRVNTLYPATAYDSTWISVYLSGDGLTSFPVDLVERFTNIIPTR